MKKQKSTPDMQLTALTTSLCDSFSQWNHINEHGANDPFWPDGCNMNLVRNHVYSYKTQIKELCEKESLALPAIYSQPTPPSVDNEYMARADEIRASARLSLSRYKQDSDFSILAQVAYNIRTEKETTAMCILGYMKGLEMAIKSDDLVTMRRHCRPEGYLKAAHDFVAALQERDYCGQQSFLGLL